MFLRGSSVIQHPVGHVYDLLADYRRYGVLSDGLIEINNNDNSSLVSVVVRYLGVTLKYCCNINFEKDKRIEIFGAQYDNGDFSSLHGVWELSMITESSVIASYFLDFSIKSIVKSMLVRSMIVTTANINEAPFGAIKKYLS